MARGKPRSRRPSPTVGPTAHKKSGPPSTAPSAAPTTRVQPAHGKRRPQIQNVMDCLKQNGNPGFTLVSLIFRGTGVGSTIVQNNVYTDTAR